MSAFEASSALLNTPLMRRRTTARDALYLTNPSAGKGPSKTVERKDGFHRKYQRSPDRAASWMRRRRLGSKSAAIPQEYCDLFTEGQRAALNIIGNVVKHHGQCEWPLDKIAAIAGVCRRTVQNAVAVAMKSGLLKVQLRPRPGRKNLPNIIRISCPTWLGWLKRVRSAFHLAIGCKTMHPTGENIFNNTENSRHDLRPKIAEGEENRLWKGRKPDD